MFIYTHRSYVPFDDYSYSICLWGLKAGWLTGFIVILCSVWTILFNVYFGKFVMTFIDIGEIGCTGIPKCHWMVIVVNLVKQIWLFCMMLPVGVVLCMLGQHWVFPPLVALIAARCRGIQATRRYRCSTGISAHLSSRAELTKILGHVVHTGDCTAQFIPNMFYTVAVMIVKAAPSWWRCPAEGNQGLLDHGEVWSFLGSGSYPL